MLIKEFLPNPVGPDKDGEYIKIFNDSDKSVNLAGWKITDASGKSFSLSGIVKPKEELSLFSSTTKISLNNNGEDISLFDQNGVLIDKLSYVGTAEEGKLVVNQKTIEIKSEFQNGQIINSGYRQPFGGILALDVFLSLILGLIAVYVILQLEKKLDRKLF